jgi:hypothetical protein
LPKHIDANITRGTARFPGLEIEIAHSRSPSGDAEQISINLQAVPSFEAFGQSLQSANPFAFWIQAAQIAWSPWLAPWFAPWLAPWLGAAGALMLSRSTTSDRSSLASGYLESDKQKSSPR